MSIADIKRMYTIGAASWCNQSTVNEFDTDRERKNLGKSSTIISIKFTSYSLSYICILTEENKFNNRTAHDGVNHKIDEEIVEEKDDEFDKGDEKALQEEEDYDNQCWFSQFSSEQFNLIGDNNTSRTCVVPTTQTMGTPSLSALLYATFRGGGHQRTDSADELCGASTDGASAVTTGKVNGRSVTAAATTHLQRASFHGAQRGQGLSSSLSLSIFLFIYFSSSPFLLQLFLPLHFFSLSCVSSLHPEW